METKKTIRVLIAKIGLDGHDVGAKVLTFWLRDQGMEVIYTGLRQSVEQVVEIAIQEAVDVIEEISTFIKENIRIEGK